MVSPKGMLTAAPSHKRVGVTGMAIREHEVVSFDFSSTRYIDKCQIL